MPPKKAVAGAQLAEGKGKCVHCAVAAERICQRCGDYYCSKDCQVQDWPRHRYICFPLPALVYPKSHSVFQSSHELSLEGACSVDSDKTVVGATLAPSPSLIPDVEGNKICSTSNIAPQNKVPILPTPPTQLISNNSGNKAKNKNISLPNAIMPPSNNLVFMMAFKSANRCYIRDAREVADRAFAQMCEKVNTIGNELPRMVKPRPFGFCLARHNGTFQRAKTMNVFGNHSARLQLLDHGVVKSRTISDMREINDELLSLPCFTLQVQLKDVPNYAISDDFFAFISQFEGEMYVAVYEKTPGCIQVELLHPETKMSLNAKIREFCANKKIYENMNSYKKNEKLNRPNPPSGQQTTKDNKTLASPVVNNSLAVSQGSQMFTQEFLKMPETEVKNQSDPKNSLSFSDKNKETPKNPSPTTGQESISQNQSKPVSEVGNNTPAKVSLINKEVSIQSDQIQGVTAASTQETIKKDEPSDFFGSYFKQRGIKEQDLKKMSPSEVFSVFFGSRANIKDSKETPTVDLSKDLSVNQENNIPKKPAVEDLFSVFFGSRADIKDSKETSTVDLSKDLSVNQENNIDKKPAVEESKKAENSISKTLVGSTTKDEASSLEIKKLSNLTLEVPSNDEKPTTVDQAIKPAPEIVSKPKDEEVKEFLNKCLAAKITPPSENTKSDRAVPLELPKLKELLDSLSISKANPQENGIVRPKNEALLKPPFELRRFTTHSKEGIDIYVVDSSKKDRGIFGAFDSTYAGEFSTLHSRLSVITDSDPYIPQLREYVLARFEGSWYRGRVEQIITIPQHPTKYRVMYLDYTNVEDIYEIDIRRYPLDFTTPCTTNICVIEDFPHKPNAAQISFLSHALKVHQLVHVDSVNYLNNIAIIKSRSLIQKLLSL